MVVVSEASHSSFPSCGRENDMVRFHALVCSVPNQSNQSNQSNQLSRRDNLFVEKRMIDGTAFHRNAPMCSVAVDYRTEFTG